jgi:hypothetical protein
MDRSGRGHPRKLIAAHLRSGFCRCQGFYSGPPDGEPSPNRRRSSSDVRRRSNAARTSASSTTAGSSRVKPAAESNGSIASLRQSAPSDDGSLPASRWHFCFGKGEGRLHHIVVIHRPKSEDQRPTVGELLGCGVKRPVVDADVEVWSSPPRAGDERGRPPRLGRGANGARKRPPRRNPPPRGGMFSVCARSRGSAGAASAAHARRRTTSAHPSGRRPRCKPKSVHPTARVRRY